MIAIISALKKITLLLLITTLTISLGTSVNLESPTNDAIQDDITINTSNNNDAEWVYFDISGPNDDTENKTGVSNKEYVTYDFRPGNNNYGEYTITVEDSSGTDSTDVVIDGSSPSFNFPDSEYVGNNPEITVEVEDSDTGVNSVEASIGNGDAEIDDVDDSNCEGDSNCEVNIEIDTSEMSESDEFDLDVTAEDEVGNSETSSKDNIILDSEWDGDGSAEVEWFESESSVLTGFEDEDQDLDVLFQPDSVSDSTVICEVDGDEVDSDSVDASDEEESATCEFDSDDYASSVFDVTVEAEDAAGNGQTLVDGEELVWDTEAPSISTLSQPEGVSTFNSGFDLILSATDDASGIEMVEYYFDDSTLLGDGNEISLEDSGSNSVDSEFAVEPDLGQGEHTVYVRIEDNSGQTDVESFDFEYFPGRDPSVNLNALETLEVTSGETKSFTLTIENGAPFFINGIEVQSDSEVWNNTVMATGLEEEDSVEKTVTVDASNINVGTYDLVLETVDMDDSATVEVIVRATEEQRSRIKSDLQEWSNLRYDLNENISGIGTLDESNENISSFTSKISNVKAAVDDGRYYEAKNILEGVESDFENAQKTYSNALDEHKSNRSTYLLILLVVCVLVLGGGGVAAFFLYREEEMLQEIDLDVPELGVIEKLKEFVNQAEDEVEEETGYSFDGFD